MDISLRTKEPDLVETNSIMRTMGVPKEDRRIILKDAFGCLPRIAGTDQTFLTTIKRDYYPISRSLDPTGALYTLLDSGVLEHEERC